MWQRLWCRWCPPLLLRFTQWRHPAAVHQGCQWTAKHIGAAKRLLQKYKAIVRASKQLPPVKHTVEHLIETTAPRPVASCYCPLDPERLFAAKVKFATMESQGIICRSKCSWSSPLHMVEKSNDSWQPCGYYRWLNLVTKRDMYPPPYMAGHLGPAGWQEGLQQAVSLQGVLPGPSGPAGRPQDGGHHPLWAVRVSEDALWAQECRAVLPALHG